jgi:quercetin dioxygenase-like cupin family protein
VDEVEEPAGVRALRFVTSADAQVEQLPWGPHEWLCRPGLTDARDLLLVRVRMPPGAGHAFHRHPAMEEIIYVTSCDAEQWVGQETRRLGAGDSAHIPKDVVHGTYNAGRDTLVFLAILSPAVFEGPALVDVSSELPWSALRS